MSAMAMGRSVSCGGSGAGWATGRCSGAALIVLLGSVGPLPAEGAEGARIAAETTGVSPAREAKGWLQLDADQRAARARSEPLTPLQSRQIQIRERQERIRLMETYQDQRREIDALRRAERRGSELGGSRFGRGVRKQGLLMRQDREREALRLRQGMERERLGIPLGPYRRRQ